MPLSAPEGFLEPQLLMLSGCHPVGVLAGSSRIFFSTCVTYPAAVITSVMGFGSSAILILPEPPCMALVLHLSHGRLVVGSPNVAHT